MIVTCASCSEVLLETQHFCTRCGGRMPAAGPEAPPAYAGFTGFGWGCATCGGDGHALDPKRNFCPECRWLRPLAPDYAVPVEAFIWSFDAQAMGVLRGIAPLNAAAAALSNKVGRPWLEASVNGIRLGPDQLPDIFQAAIDVARALGLGWLPELYISGEQMWDCMTLGSDTQAFIVVGSVLTNFKDADLRYVLGREMGRVAAGHALWKTVLQFVSGRNHGNRTIMGNGVLQLLNPGKLIESAIDAPLMAWARHAEITADRAGLLAVGDREAARRVATQWSLKSFPLYARLNLAALERDIANSDDRQIALSEWTMSTTPYLARRLRLLDEYHESDTLKAWRAVIDHWTRPPPPQPAAPPPPDPNIVRLNCVACGHAMRLARTDLEGKAEAKVRCPNTACGKVLEITPRPPDKAEVKRIVATAPQGMRITCPACQRAMVAPADALADKESVNIRCPGEDCRKVLTVRRPPALKPAPEPARGGGGGGGGGAATDVPRPEEMVE